MLEFILRALGLKRDQSTASKNTAKERLRLVLVQDRASMSPATLQALKEDLIRVISEYMEIDQTGLEVSFNSDDNAVALVCNIPILRLKRNVKEQETV
ncbi:MAG TPA: cell division topological specificity factor MinE [Clostridia bacterium]|nr:cell division topological specificity factor MinE [Clostridia bacterium]